MAVRTALLNWNNIARDTDFSKYIETVSEPGVIEWLTVTSTKVAIWKARVPCLRTNGETIFALVSVTSEVTISGNGDVYIEVSQTYIDDWELANEDWTGIATIQVGTMPSKNALKLATISNGVVTDARNMIAKVWELKTYIQSLNSRMNTAEQKIDQIIEDKAVDHLEETGLVWEKYTLANTLFKQITPTFANSTVDSNIWDTDANKQIHIQRLATGTASNKLKLKAKKIWAPTTWLVVEVRRWVQVDVSDTEAYWYWNELVCSGSIPYSSISTDYQEFEVTMNWQFWGTKWEKLDIVVYQTWNIVNSTNYYAIACDSTQYSEWFSLVAVNGTTRTRSKLMPYCIADGFAQSMLCKTYTQEYTSLSRSLTWKDGASDTKTYTTTQAYEKFYIKFTGTYTGVNYFNSESFDIKVSVNNVEEWTWHRWRTSWTQVINEMCELSNVPSGATISIYVSEYAPYSNITYGNMQCLATIPWNLVVIQRKLKPSELKEIWWQTTIILFWNVNWQRYWEFLSETSNSAVTWTITLWNCQWFKTIVDEDWKKRKIPVYWVE